MKHPLLATSFFALSISSMSPSAIAGNIANCEIVLMETIADENGNGGAQVASYRPAGDFIASVYSREEDTLNEIDGLAIRALLCSRKDVIISDTDFDLLATGVPFILSQNFDSSTSNLLTYFFKDGSFQYTHKGDDLSDEALAKLTQRLVDFNSREDTIAALTAARAKARQEQEAQATSETAAEENRDASDDIVDDTKPIDIVEIEPNTAPLEAGVDIAETDADNTLEIDIKQDGIEIVELKTAAEETISQAPKADIPSPDTVTAPTIDSIPSVDSIKPDTGPDLTSHDDK
ncbi:MAG: hypothetical protein ABJG88_08330 [Litorimonas sp.]